MLQSQQHNKKDESPFKYQAFPIGKRGEENLFLSSLTWKNAVLVTVIDIGDFLPTSYSSILGTLKKSVCLSSRPICLLA